MRQVPKYTFHYFAGDIRLWIILFFLLRLYGITNPPLESAHIWRQVTVFIYGFFFYTYPMGTGIFIWSQDSGKDLLKYFKISAG
ncbi:MAG: hypothetical protein NT175_11520 [Bacteroidetes bacterium]|nr:hypothetical protein [Bacteroidota bacterium]